MGTLGLKTFGPKGRLGFGEFEGHMGAYGSAVAV